MDVRTPQTVHSGTPSILSCHSDDEERLTASGSLLPPPSGIEGPRTDADSGCFPRLQSKLSSVAPSCSHLGEFVYPQVKRKPVEHTQKQLVCVCV